MALSMLLRVAPAFRACPNVIIAQQASRLSSSALQNVLRVRTVRLAAPKNGGVKASNAPILNAVRNSSMAASAPSRSSATTLWVVERAVSVALIGLVPIAIAYPSKPLDVVMAVSLIAHVYWGIEAVITEYVRTLLFGPVIPKVAHGLLIGLMVTTLGGLFYLIFNDIGLAATVRKLWAIKPRE